MEAQRKISNNSVVFALSKEDEPVLRVPQGAVVVFETKDCYCGRIRSAADSLSDGPSNPATGPLYVEGAKAGDTLRVEILDISTAPFGIMRVRPGMGAYGSMLKKAEARVFNINDGVVAFSDCLTLPIKPMIGVIGVAPGDEGIPTDTPGVHGGNMDCKRIVRGAILYLPVFVQGALLSIGDLHAVMGDGEAAICGLEVAGEVKVRVDVVHEMLPFLPVVIEGDHLMTIGSSETLDDAAKIASDNMHRFLTTRGKLDAAEAAMLLSLVGDLAICQIVDPLKTVRMEIPLAVLRAYEVSLPGML